MDLSGSIPQSFSHPRPDKHLVCLSLKILSCKVIPDFPPFPVESLCALSWNARFTQIFGDEHKILTK